MKDFFEQRRPHDGYSYDEYLENWKQEKSVSPEEVDPDERKMLYFLQYNWDRQQHTHEAYTPSSELQEAAQDIDESQLWMVITEPWCGDSAFLLPVIAEAAALNDAVTLRILHRDENLDIMDQYLTGGSRSIPKLVVFSEDGVERFAWGPRPEDVRQTYEELKATHDDKMEAISKLVEYYENNESWDEADKELVEAIRTSQTQTSAHSTEGP